MSKLEKEVKIREKCPYGFDCGSMMLQAGTIAHNCENLTECVKLTKAIGVSWEALQQPTFNLVQYREETRRYWEQENQRWIEERRRIRQINRIRQHEAAVILLKQRGNSQSFNDFDLENLNTQLKELSESIQDKLSKLNSGYIAPENSDVNVYNVKHPPTSYFRKDIPIEEIREKQKIYYYHKLQSNQAQFKAIENASAKQLKERRKRTRSDNCKTIHLSHSWDARNIQARIGVERRDRLNEIKTKLNKAIELLYHVEDLLEQPFDYDDVLAQSQNAEQNES